jgi:hypothetical protein
VDSHANGDLAHGSAAREREDQTGALRASSIASRLTRPPVELTTLSDLQSESTIARHRLAKRIAH